MRKRKPQSLWDDICQWWDGEEDEGEKAQDPTLVMHVLFGIPFAIALLAAMRKLSGL